MKKFLSIFLIVIMALCFASCGQPSDTSLIKESEIGSLYSDPEKFKGRTFTFTAQVLSIEEDSGEFAIQAYYDINNYDKNTVIYYNESSLDINEDDYIKVKGTIEGEFEGENALGGEVTAPIVNAKSVKVISITEALEAEKTINVDKTIEKSGYKVTIKKVDFTKNETRIFIKVTNTGSSEISFYADEGVILQNGKQYEADYNFDYPEVSYEIKEGVSSEGVVSFPLIDDKRDFSILFSGYDYDYNDLDFEFTVNIE